MLVLLLICVVLCLLVCSQGKRNKNEPPSLPNALPLIGHAHLLIGNSTHLWNLLIGYSNEYRKHDGVISFHIGPMTLYGVSHPEDILTLTNNCLQKNQFFDFAKPWIGEGLLTSTLSIWKIHRKLLNPAFNQKVLDGFLEVFNKQSRQLVKDFENEIGKNSFDHYNYIQNISLETICQTALGLDSNETNVQNSQYLMAVDQILNVIIERIQKLWFYSEFIYSWSSLKKKQDECLKILHTTSNTILKKTKENYLLNKNKKMENKQGPEFKTFMRLLLELAEEKGVFNNHEIREEVDTMIAAGYETIATALVYCILMIGSYPKVQEKIFEELHEVFDDDDRDVMKDDLSRLFYLEAVLKESMRLYPVAPLIIRWLDKDVKLRNCTLSKGNSCLLSIYEVHRSPLWGPDADEFRPERWLDPDSLPKSPAAFFGFGAGKRNCIGKAYATMSLKVTLAHIFRNYKVKGDHTKMKLKYEVVLKPVSGHHISVQRRNNKFI